MTDFAANFTLSEIEAIESTFMLNESTQLDAVFVLHPTPSKLSELDNDADYVQDANYVHTDNNFTDALLSNLNNQSGVNTGDQDLSDYALIEDIPTKVSELTNDSGFISEETDPIYTADKINIALKSEIPTALSELSQDNTHRLVTDTEKNTWNAKSNFSGSYADLSNIPVSFTPSAHTQDISTINELQNKLDDKANLSGATFSGLISAVNLSGTNTGDQDLSSYATIVQVEQAKLFAIAMAVAL